MVKEEEESPKEDKTPPPPNKAGKPKMVKEEESPKEEERPTHSKVGSLAMGMKIPMPGAAPPKVEEKKDEGISFEKPVLVAQLSSVTKARAQLPNRTQKVPTRPTRIFISDGMYYKGIAVTEDATAEAVILQMLERMSGSLAHPHFLIAGP